MTLPIFYIETIGGTDFINLSEETSKHVVQVLRMKVGEQLQLTDGQGSLITTEVVDDHKKKCTVKVLQRQFLQKPGKAVCVAISLLKNAARFEWFLEKATEVGVTEIIPLISDRTEKQHFRHERMKNIVTAAMLQSQQVWLPVLRAPTSLEEAITSNKYSDKLIAHCTNSDKLNIHDFSNSNSACILIGPEGDFTNDEIDLALTANFKPVTLGTTRLRTETAGVVAATFLCVR